ncbi:MAG: hypothetical protein II180_12335 [Proteobacteria bacterium]|nr:hypothetical protein [Pseudomonadota bacterium]
MFKRTIPICAFVAVAAMMASCGDDQSSSPVSSSKCGGAECLADQTCVKDVCVDNSRICGEAVCEDGQTCDNGECKDAEVPPVDPCAEKTCENGQVCVKGECVDDDPCAKINCDTGTTCLNAKCVDDACIEGGVEKSCDAGKICSKGECVDDGCKDKTCNDGEVCVAGMCEDALCLDKNCGDGTTCKAGECIENACLEMSCDNGTVCRAGDCVLEACVDKVCEQDKVCQTDGSCKFDSDPALIVSIVNDKKNTNENGGSVGIQIALNHQPASAVTISAAISNDKEAQVMCHSESCDITFTPENWNTPQILNIEGIPDGKMDGDQKFDVTLTSASDDSEFNGLTQSLKDFVNEDVDKVSVILDYPEDIMTSEAGLAAEIKVSLSSKPEKDVLITVKSSDETEGKVFADAEGKTPVDMIKISPENWDQPQSIWVIGQDDEATDGAVEYEIQFGKTLSEDAGFNGLDVPAIKLANADNDKAGATLTATTIETDENGGSSLVGFILNAQPTQDVVVTAKSNKPTEAVAEVDTITFTPENWDVKQSFKIVGVHDYVIDGDQDFRISFNFKSADTQYNIEAISLLGTNHDTDTADFVITADELTVNESGSQTDVLLSLTSKPSADVTVKVTVSDDTEIALEADTFVFTSENWDKPQIIKVQGVDDHIIDGSIVSTISLAATSGDKNFDGVKLDNAISITTEDDDKAEILVEGEGASLNENTADTATYSIALAAQPTKNVVVTLKTTDASELALVSAATVTFTPENWNTPVEVNVKSVDDSLTDGNQKANITMTAASDDENFNGISALSPDYIIVDNEQASIVVLAENTTIRPGENNATIKVSLATQPTANVTVTFVSSDPSTANVSQTLTFTPSNWNTPQTVTVDNDGCKTAQVDVTISLKSASTCASYNNLKIDDVKLTVIAFEKQDFKFSGKHETVKLYPGKYKLQVWGASGGDGVGYRQDYSSHAGLGGYSEGILTLTQATELYVVVGGVGGKGEELDGKSTGVGGGYNGGGFGSDCTHKCGSSWGGGGGTDIRIGSDSLYTRVIVAGGGGGPDNAGGAGTGGADDGSGGYGGGVNGGRPTADGVIVTSKNIATQTSGYRFGEGESFTGNGDVGAGGGGWFGGFYGIHAQSGGFGGSGFVWAGNPDVSDATIGGSWLLGEEYKLSEAKTIAGNATFESTAGATETGHAGNGYARITLIKE